MTRGWIWLVCGALAGCTCGTTTQDELEASYEVMPDLPASELTRKVLDALEDDVRIVDIFIGPRYASAQVVRPSVPDRMVRFRYDGVFVDEEERFEPLPVGLDARTVGLAKNELPIDRFDEMVARARGAIDRPIASFEQITLFGGQASFGEAAEEEPEWAADSDAEPAERRRPTLGVYFRSFREGSTYVEMDFEG
ncbi:MAG: hypothetical protein H6724_12840, partial [Sandaracinus sp.]|nr:hypothetical protein [Sandaracinus sp.]